NTMHIAAEPQDDTDRDLARQVDAMLANGSLEGTAAQYAQPRGANLLRRTEAVEAWHDARSKDGLWQYARSLDGAPYPIASIRDEAGIGARGINFASQDY